MTKSFVVETTFSQYTVTSVLGEGGSGRVLLATSEDGEEYALKLLNDSSTDKRKRFKNELLFCARNSHRNIVKVVDYGILSSEKRKQPFYIMPLYRKSLRSLMQKGIRHDHVVPYFGQLLDGVEAAHMMGVIHRDIKPENILLDESSDILLVADFGVAHFSEAQLNTLIETAPGQRLANFQYAAPEQRSRGTQVDKRADIYALGLILNEMFTGEVPHGTSYKKIASASGAHRYLDSIVERMIRQSPSDRYASIAEVKQDLIAHRERSISLQRLSELRKTVIPTSEIDDPIAGNPIGLVGVDWGNNTLTLELTQPVNQTWIWAFQNMGSYSAPFDAPPQAFSFDGARAYVQVGSRDAQNVIDHFKTWLPITHARYVRKLKDDASREEQRQRERLEALTKAEQERQDVLGQLKI